jgi:hypothetical protein
VRLGGPSWRKGAREAAPATRLSPLAAAPRHLAALAVTETIRSLDISLSRARSLVWGFSRPGKLSHHPYTLFTPYLSACLLFFTPGGVSPSWILGVFLTRQRSMDHGTVLSTEGCNGFFWLGGKPPPLGGKAFPWEGRRHSRQITAPGGKAFPLGRRKGVTVPSGGKPPFQTITPGGKSFPLGRKPPFQRNYCTWGEKLSPGKKKPPCQRNYCTWGGKLSPGKKASIPEELLHLGGEAFPWEESLHSREITARWGKSFPLGRV